MVRKNKSVISILSLLLLVLALSGCPKEPYRAALQGSDDVAASVHAAIGITTQYYGDGLIGDDEKKSVAGVLQVVTLGNMAFRHCVVAAHTAGAMGQTPYLACADAFVQQISSTDPSTLGFKNPKAQAALSNYLRAVKTAINGIGLAVQNAKGGK